MRNLLVSTTDFVASFAVSFERFEIKAAHQAILGFIFKSNFKRKPCYLRKSVTLQLDMISYPGSPRSIRLKALDSERRSTPSSISLN